MQLNMEERVKLVTEALGTRAAPEVRCGLGKNGTIPEEILNHINTLSEDSLGEEIATCKREFWQSERGGNDAFAWIMILETLLLRREIYTPRPLGIGVKAVIEVWK